MKTRWWITLSVLVLAGGLIGAVAVAPPVSPPGSSAAGANQVTITISGDYRIITSNGLPNHATGPFPNAHNPNTVAAQQHYFRVTLKPTVAAKITPYDLGRFGIALNGVPFEAAGNEFWNGDRNSGWQYEVLGGKINLGLDDSNAHVQPSGSYHYHGLPAGLIAKLGGTGSGPKMILLGYAGDGFPIYNQYDHADPKDLKSPLKKLRPSFGLKKGNRPGNPGGPYDGTFTADFEYVAGSGDLDECNGRFGLTAEYPQGIYHYLISETFPYISRQFRGTPDATFLMPGPPGGGFRGPPGGRGGPPGFRGPPPFPPGGYPPPPGGYPPPPAQ